MAQVGKPRHRLKRRELGRVQLGQMRAVARPQQRPRHQRRAGIGVRPMRRPDRLKRRAQRVAVGQPALGQRAGDPGRGLARASRLGGAEVIEATPGVGLEVAQRLGFLGHPRQRHGQQRVLVHVGQVSGVIGVLIGQHGIGGNPHGRRRKGSEMKSGGAQGGGGAPPHNAGPGRRRAAYPLRWNRGGGRSPSPRPARGGGRAVVSRSRADPAGREAATPGRRRGVAADNANPGRRRGPAAFGTSAGEEVGSCSLQTIWPVRCERTMAIWR